MVVADAMARIDSVLEARPLHLLSQTVLSLKSPTGAFIAPLRCTNANLSGQGPSILLRKTVLSLKSPTGAFIAPLRCANANF